MTESILAQHNNNAITSTTTTNQFSHDMDELGAENPLLEEDGFEGCRRKRGCYSPDGMYNSDDSSSDFYHQNSTDEEEDNYDKYDGDYQLSPNAHDEDEEDDHLIDEDFLPEETTHCRVAVKQEEMEDGASIAATTAMTSSSSTTSTSSTVNSKAKSSPSVRTQKRKKKNKKDCVDEHDIDTFQCGQCSRVYQYLSSLKSHCKSVHKSDAGWKGQYSNVISKKFAKNRDFACPLCDSSCASHYGLRRHMTTKHRDAQKKLLLFYLIEDLCLKENMKHKDQVLNNNKDYVLKLKKKHLDELEQDLEICTSPSNDMSEEEEEPVEKKPKQKHTRGQGKWTESEKRHFLEGVRIYGKNNLHMISKFIKTKDVKQVEKFSNKYFSKLREGFQVILGANFNSAPSSTPEESEEEKYDTEEEEKVNDSEDRDSEESDVSPRSKPISMKRKRKSEECGRKKIKKDPLATSLNDLLLDGPDLSSTPPNYFPTLDFLGHSVPTHHTATMSHDETLLQQQVQMRLQALHQQHLLLQKQQQEEDIDMIKPDVVELFNNMLFDETIHSNPGYVYHPYQACQFMIDTHDH